MILGLPGLGKSHNCVALGIKAIQFGFSAQYFRFDELMTALKADADLPPVRLKRKKDMSTALLMIDEIGCDPMTRDEASQFFRLVSYRYGRGAMILTTNKSIRDWTELLAGDEILATAILDRLLHRANVFNVRGRSYRLCDLEESLNPAAPNSPPPPRLKIATCALPRARKNPRNTAFGVSQCVKIGVA